jgi:glycosyltransferase involved in cell wall biosynthesis
VISVAHSLKGSLAERLRISPQRIVVIHNGVDLPALADRHEARERLRRSLGLDQRHVLLGSIGRLAPVKDFAVAIEAIGRLAGERDVHLVLIGDGPERQNLEQLAQNTGVAGRVHFVGQQSNIAEWFAALDLYINCSYSEAMNLAILEAMAAGVPCVVTDVGESRHMVNGETASGVVIPRRQHESLAGAITSLIDDEPLRLRMSHNGLSKHQTLFSTETMVANYAALYERCIATSGEFTL